MGNKHSVQTFLPPRMHKPIRTIVMFDIDDTLLFRRDITGQMNLHWARVAAGLAKDNESHKAREDLISPRPDFFFADDAPSFIYLRPGVHEALEYAKALTAPENIHAFSASSNPEHILEITGLRNHFNKAFGREYTDFAVKDSRPTLLKNLAKLREALGFTENDRILMIDDRPDWVINAGSQDRVVPVRPFQPPYRLYDVVVVKNPGEPDPTDTLFEDSELMNTLRLL